MELLTGQKPISNLVKNDEERSLVMRFLASMEANNLDAILDAQVLEQSMKAEGVIGVARLAERCLNLKGQMRPTMKEVATELESLRMSQMPMPADVDVGDDQCQQQVGSSMFSGTHRCFQVPILGTHGLLVVTVLPLPHYHHTRKLFAAEK